MIQAIGSGHRLAAARKSRAAPSDAAVPTDNFTSSPTLPLLENIQATRAKPSGQLRQEISLSIPAAMIGGLAGYTVWVSSGDVMRPLAVSDAAVVPQDGNGLLKMTLDGPVDPNDQVWLVSGQERYAPPQLSSPRQWTERADRVPDLSQVQPMNPVQLKPPDSVVQALRDAKRVLVVSHTPPDGDTVGSGLALRRLLENLGKEADYFLDGPMPGWLRDQATPGECREWDDIREKSYDLVVMVDVAQLDRVGRARPMIEQAPSVVIIDHHQTTPPPLSCPVQSWITPADAAAVLVASLAETLAPQQWQGIAAPLITGILTDTGLLANATRSETAPVLKHLLQNRGDADLAAACSRLKSQLPDEAQGMLMSPVHLKGQLLAPQGQSLRDALLENQGLGYSEEISPSRSLLTVPRTAQQLATQGGNLADPNTNSVDLQDAMFARLNHLARTSPVAVMLVEHDDHVQVCIRSHDPEMAPRLAQSLGGGGKPGIAAAKSSLPLAQLQELVRNWDV